MTGVSVAQDIKAEAKSNTNAAKAKETAILARAEVKKEKIRSTCRGGSCNSVSASFRSL